VRRLAFVFLISLSGASLPPPGHDFARAIIVTHNAERASVGTKPLAWSHSLAADAQKWADHMARTRTFEHAPQSAHGENLWMGTRGRYAFEEMVGSWIDEKSMYKPGLFPNNTRTGQWQDVGHYTQLIWGNTTHVGCAIASDGTDDYLVCRYGPPGNWIGQNPVSPKG
jgi:uncharacterized protein YkwD